MSGIQGKYINPLLEISANVFSIVAPLRTGDNGQSLPESFRDRIFAVFESLERDGFDLQLEPNAVNEVKFALAAYVDEMILGSAWPYKSAWMSSPLQLQYFGEHLAGESFFERLARLRQGGDTNKNVLEVYYVCMQLGFEGMYKLRGLEQLLALQVDLRTQLNDYQGKPHKSLSASRVDQTGFIESVRREVPYWVIATFTVSILFFVYLGYSYTLDYKTAEVRKEIEKLERQMARSIVSQSFYGQTGEGKNKSRDGG